MEEAIDDAAASKLALNEFVELPLEQEGSKVK